MEIIRYLTEQERALTRPLYEECFPEDTREFVDYYYHIKVRDNRILVMEEPEHGKPGGEVRLQVMLHLNPFLFRFGRERCWLNYIVAVAAASKVRKQGKMFRCMTRALKDLAAEGQPFTFLIPANPRVYESSGFAFVSGTGDGSGSAAVVGDENGSVAAAGNGSSPVTGDAVGCTVENRTDVLHVEPAVETEDPTLVDFSNELMAGQFQVFPLWSREYLKRLRLELEAQEGAVLTVRDGNGSLVGAVTYGKEEERGELQHILTAPGDRERVLCAVRSYFLKEGISQVEMARMPFMARILHLPRMLELLGGACAEPFRLRVRLTDELIRENNGCFELYCQEGAGGLRRIPADQVECGMQIGRLAEFLFEKLRMYIREWV